MTIALAEEFGELCKAVLDESAADVRKEAVQTAVMAARVAIDGDGSVCEWRAAKGLDPLAACLPKKDSAK
jgi:Mg2+/citrate symporter